MKSRFFDYKLMRNFFIVFSTLLLLLYLYLFFTNFLLYHTAVEFSMITLGIIGPIVGFIASFKLKHNLLSKISPTIFVFTFLLFIHMLSFPGMDLMPNVRHDFYLYSIISANMLLGIGILIAMIDRQKKINSILNLLITFVVGVLLYSINYHANLPSLIVDGKFTTYMMVLCTTNILLFLISTILWFVEVKHKEEKSLVPFGIVLVLLTISEVFFTLHFRFEGILSYFSSSMKFVSVLITMYLIFKVNLILPYNDLYQALIEENSLQKKLKKEINKSYIRLTRSQQIGHVGSWELDIENMQIWASDEAFRIYGIEITKDNILPLDQVQSAVLKEDREKLDQALSDLITQNIPYNVKFKIKSNNVIRYLHSVATLSTKNNKPYKVYGVINDITELKNEEEKLRYASYHDHLTNVYNRRYFVEQRELINFERYLPITTVILDINGLKIINDSFGHNAGNRVLKKIATILKENAGDSGFVSRIGGDEFAIIYPRTDKYTVEKHMSEMIEEISNTKVENINLSLAYGMAEKNSMEQNLDMILKEAEDDMYLHKISHSASVRSKIIDALLKTLYEKDNVSEEHSQRVSTYAYQLAIAANLSPKKASDIMVAGSLHDIGKVTIANSILNKNGKLTEKEYEIIKTHPEKGYSILHSIGDMDIIANYVLQHHEFYNGKGYPKGLKGDDISYEARLISIADAYDAMTSFRTYKDEKTKTEAIKELIACKGKQFDPELVDIFIEKVLKMED